MLAQPICSWNMISTPPLTIMVVEDDPVVLELVTAVLAEQFDLPAKQGVVITQVGANTAPRPVPLLTVVFSTRCPTRP